MMDSVRNQFFFRSARLPDAVHSHLKITKNLWLVVTKDWSILWIILIHRCFISLFVPNLNWFMAMYCFSLARSLFKCSNLKKFWQWHESFDAYSNNCVPIQFNKLCACWKWLNKKKTFSNRKIVSLLLYSRLFSDNIKSNEIKWNEWIVWYTHGAHTQFV